MSTLEIAIETTIQAPADRVWESWTSPEHITRWNFASPEWHCPRAEIDLREGGSFCYRMEEKDGEAGFDFTGVFDRVERTSSLAFHLEDGRAVKVHFSTADGITTVSEIFEAEDQNSGELQRQGWQAILNNFGHYVESMKQDKSYGIHIMAPRHKVWDLMLGESTFRAWVKGFSDDVIVEGDWGPGNEMDFYSETRGGTRAVVEVLEKPARLKMNHIASLSPDREPMPQGQENWIGTLEEYILTEDEEGTKITINVHYHESFGNMFDEGWEKSLELLKEMCEAS